MAYFKLHLILFLSMAFSFKVWKKNSTNLVNGFFVMRLYFYEYMNWSDTVPSYFMILELKTWEMSERAH